MKKIIKFILYFFAISVAALFLGDFIFPSRPDNKTLIPNWYMDLDIIFAATLSVRFISKSKEKGKKAKAWLYALIISSLFVLLAEIDRTTNPLKIILIILIPIIAVVLFLGRNTLKRCIANIVKKKPKTQGTTVDVSTLSIAPGLAALPEIQKDCTALGTDLVELTNNGPCCENCAKFRRRIYSISGKDKRFPKFPPDYKPDGCLSAYPFIEGVMEPSFSAANIVEYSNRPFIDDRTFLEKEQYNEWHNMRGEQITSIQPTIQPSQSQRSSPISQSSLPDDYDELLDQAAMIIIETNQASVSMLERRLKLSYSRAARLIDQLEEIGVVGPFEGSKPRQIIITKQQYMLMRQENAFSAPPNKRTEININELIRNEEQWRRQQYQSELDYVDSMEGHQFEYWCADLLRKNGFINVEVTPGSGDQGVDILAKKDGIKYAVQCKCYSSDLGNKPVQEVNTGKAIYHCQVGAVMTNRYFTAGAKQAAEATGVLLWDRDKLIEMLK